MKLFFTDESEVNPGGHSDLVKDCEMFIYGGVILNEEQFRNLTDFLYDLKDRYEFPQKMELKWSFISIWNQMKKFEYIKPEFNSKNPPGLYDSLKEDYDNLKEEVLRKIAEEQIPIVIAIRPDGLLNATDDQRVQYSVEAVCRKFEKILKKEENYGLVLADELPRIGSDSIKYEYILDLCYSGSGKVNLDQVISVIPNTISDLSPIHQLNDILLGCIQYYILQFMKVYDGINARGVKISKKLMGIIADNFYSITINQYQEYVLNSGILLYPPGNNRKDTRAGRLLDALEGELYKDFEIE